MKYSLTFVLIAGLVAMLYAFWKSSWIDSQDEGTSKMKTIGASISEGAMSFLKAEYRVLAVFVILISILLGFANAGESHLMR